MVFMFCVHEVYLVFPAHRMAFRPPCIKSVKFGPRQDASFLLTVRKFATSSFSSCCVYLQNVTSQFTSYAVGLERLDT